MSEHKPGWVALRIPRTSKDHCEQPSVPQHPRQVDQWPSVTKFVGWLGGFSLLVTQWVTEAGEFSFPLYVEPLGSMSSLGKTKYVLGQLIRKMILFAKTGFGCVEASVKKVFLDRTVC